MYATVFEFNGIKSSDLGIYILNFDGFSNSGTISGSHYTFNTSKPAGSCMWNFHGAKAETPLERTYQIGKLNCDNQLNYEFTREEFAFLQSWLERNDGYKPIRFLQEGYEHTWFFCQLQLDYIYLGGGQLVGAEIKMTCNAPYGYSDVQNFEIECKENDSFKIYNDSDKTGSIVIDEVNIKCTSDADSLVISNSLEEIYCLNGSYKTIIKNCSNGEVIVIANRQIQTNMENSHTNANIMDDFNFCYLRLINLSNPLSSQENTFENRMNTFTVTGGSCHLFFSYRTIRTVMV